MPAIMLVIGAAFFLGLGALLVLLILIRGRQYEDLEGAAVRILIPDETEAN